MRISMSIILIALMIMFALAGLGEEIAGIGGRRFCDRDVGVGLGLVSLRTIRTAIILHPFQCPQLL